MVVGAGGLQVEIAGSWDGQGGGIGTERGSWELVLTRQDQKQSKQRPRVVLASLERKGVQK